MRNRGIFALTMALLPTCLYAQADITIVAPQVDGSALINDTLKVPEADDGSDQRLSEQTLQRRSALPSLTYSPSSSRRRQNFNQFVDKARTTDPAGAAKMQALFASTDIIGVIDQKMQQTYGMRATNVADAYAVWWVSAWMGARGRSDDATPRQMAMVKQQATNGLIASSQFSNATDAGKQEMAEAMLVQAALIGDTVDTYKDNPVMMRQLGAAVRKGAKASGLNLDTMKLTDEGFVPSGKTGAAEPAPNAPEQALAANDAPAPAATNPPYLLLAAAGGAGIGGVFLLGKVMGRRG